MPKEGVSAHEKRGLLLEDSPSRVKMDFLFHPDVVVVDDDPPALGAIARSLEHRDLRVHAFSDPSSALQFLAAREVAVVVSDYRMPLMTGTQLLERAAALQPRAARILLTGYTDFQTSLDAVNRGSVSRLLSKPWEEEELASAIRDLAATSTLDRVLAHLAPFQADLLGLRRAEEMLAALQELLANDLQLEVQERKSPDGRPPKEEDTVVAVCGGRMLRIPLTKAHREIFRSVATRRQLLDLVDIAARATLLAAAQRDLESELARRAENDALSGLLNRRGFDVRLASEVGRSHRYGAPLSLLFIDIDRFKELNDSYGHGAADLFIMRLGQLLRTITRSADSAARYGGDEFVLILPGVETAGAIDMADRVRQEASRVDVTSDGHRVTLSVGVSQWREGMGPRELVEQADRAAYHVKESGRDGIAWCAGDGVAPLRVRARV